MNDPEYYYKVVRLTFDENCNQVWESSNWWVPGSLRCFYKINETTYPKVGKLFVFNSMESANNFMKIAANNDDLLLLKVTVTNPLHPIAKMLGVHYLYDCNLIEYWKNPTSFLSHRCVDNLPGTILVDSITPVEIVIPVNENKI